MGKIKSRLIRRSTKKVNSEGIKFDKDFEKNKRILKGIMPSKKLRNQMAGLLSRIEKTKFDSR
jgi:ribosomal protein S17E